MSESKEKPKLQEQLVLERCPHCRVASPTLEKMWETRTARYDGTNDRFWRIYRCTRCGGVVTAGGRGWDHDVIEMHPSHMEADAAIPEKARDYLNQALDSLQSPAGAVMLAASVVDELLKQKGHKNGKLYPRIKKAQKEGLITADMAKWAHQVRLDANDQRHSDENALLPGEEDAQRSIEFAIALAEFLFVLPSKVTRGLEETSPGEDSPPDNPDSRVESI